MALASPTARSDFCDFKALQATSDRMDREVRQENFSDFTFVSSQPPSDKAGLTEGTRRNPYQKNVEIGEYLSVLRLHAMWDAYLD